MLGAVTGLDMERGLNGVPRHHDSGEASRAHRVHFWNSCHVVFLVLRKLGGCPRAGISLSGVALLALGEKEGFEERLEKIFHNFVRPHEGLDGKTPAEATGITVEGANKWLTIIQNASHVQPCN